MKTFYVYNDTGHYLGAIRAVSHAEAERLADARYRGIWSSLHDVTDYAAR